MAPKIAEAGCRFSTVMVSPAVRAQETIERIAKNLPREEITWSTNDRLYTFDYEQVWDFAAGLDNSLADIVLVGHNPALTEFLNELTGETIANLPTCGYAQISLPGASWAAMVPGAADLRVLLRPKMFD